MSEVSVIDKHGYTPFLKKVTVFASGGVFLDGYLLVIIGIALVQLTPVLNLDTFWTGLVGASALVGILFGSLIFGYLTDIIGRKIMYMLDLAAIVILSILCMFVDTPLQLVILRFLIGMAIGADYPISASLLTEYAPTKYRALMMGVLMFTWYVGAVVSSVVGYILLTTNPNGWTWMLGSAAIPAIILLVGRFDTPESPRWLMQKGHTEKALAAVKRIYGEDADLTGFGEEVKKTKWLALFQKGYFKRTMFCGLFFMLSMVPCFAIYTFGPQILSALGMSQGNDWIWGYALINVAFALGCIPAIPLMEKMGRRKTLIWGFVLCMVGLVLVSVTNPPVWLVLVGFFIYAFFNGLPSVLCFLYPSELFPTEIRASAIGFATAMSRVGAAIGTFALPIFLAKYGIQMTMITATFILFLGLLVAIFMAPETQGLTLTECSSVDGKKC